MGDFAVSGSAIWRQLLTPWRGPLCDIDSAVVQVAPTIVTQLLLLRRIGLLDILVSPVAECTRED